MKNIVKNAAFRAKNINDILEYLSRFGYKSKDELNKAVRFLYGRKGDSGSIFFDMGKGVAKRVPGLKRIGQGADKLIDKYQRKITDFDMKAGHAVADKLKNTRAKNWFINKRTVRLPSSAKGEADKLLEFEVPSLFAPIDKTKEKVLPVAGAFYISDLINKKNSAARKAQEYKGGEETMGRSAEYRQELINKIAKTLCEKPQSKKTKNSKNKNANKDEVVDLVAKASNMLKKAALVIKSQQQQLEKIAEENKRLELTIIAKNRSARAVKLASEMLEKGLIKSAEFDDKVDEIIEMDDAAYNLLNETISNIKKEAADEGVDSLTFIAEEGMIKKRATLADSLKEMSNN